MTKPAGENGRQVESVEHVGSTEAGRPVLLEAGTETARLAVCAHAAVVKLSLVADDAEALQLENETEVQQAARAFGIPIRHRQMRHVLANLADVLMDDICNARPNAGAARTLRAFAPDRDLRLWEEHGILPLSAYHESARAIALATEEASTAEEANLQLLRCQLARAYCAQLVEHIASATVTGTCTGNPALGAYDHPAVLETTQAVSAFLLKM